jgi:hypothetical protein
MRRTATALISAIAAAAFATSVGAQEAPTTGISISLASWLEPWDAAAGGGWMFVPAGQTPKGSTAIADAVAAVPPGSYDLFWIQDAGLAPLLMAEDVAVTEGELTEIRVATGARLEVADWVEPRDAAAGWFGAIPSETTETIIRTATGNSLFLPPGRYDLFYEQDETDELPAIWIGTYAIETPFGGLGIEVGVDDAADDIVVVRTLPGGPSDTAGILAGDVIRAIDGTPLAGLELADAVALLRGPPETDAVLTVGRGKDDSIDIAVTRAVVEAEPIARADGGVRLVLPEGVAIAPDGWWGVTFTGGSAGNLINWSTGTADTPLLIGPTSYDVYWNPDGEGEAELIATDIAAIGEIVDVAPAAAGK